MIGETVVEQRGDDTGGRSRYLIDGRRVTVSDLLEADLLPAGARLRFKRNRIGVTFDATVTDKGRIRLEPNGEEFRSPSRAAMVAAGMRAVDGWRAWLVVDQNRLLDAVRQELLDREISTAPATPHPQDDDIVRHRVHERLRQARRSADEHASERVSVRELLALWGATDRGDQVSQIEADLANHGLVTSPSFRAVTLDTVVSLITPPEEEAAPTAVVGTADLDDLPVTEDDEDDGGLNVRLTVGNLSPLVGVTSVGPHSTIREAITIMVLNDFSQLAVLVNPRKLRGVVTWRSIAQAMHQKADPTFADAIDPLVEAVPYDRDLFEVLPSLRKRDFVFVKDESEIIAGIVTTADVAQRYGEMATPFFQLGELDQTLRWVLSRAIDVETIQQLCNRTITSFDQLSMGDYQRVMENRDVWERLGWPLDRATFISRLREIRLIRNKVMHFHPDPVPEDAVDKLRRFNSLLHRYRVRT